MANEKLEAKILEELKKRVIERETELRRDEEERLRRETTKEALTEVTSLSHAELDAIEAEIRARLTRERELSRRRRRGLAIAAGVILCVTAFALWEEYGRRAAVILNEGFNDDKAGWKTDSGLVFRRYLKDGAYIFDNNRQDYCYWDDIPFAPPNRYTIEARCVWKSGKYDAFGVMLSESSARFTAFQLSADGRASVAKFADNKFLPFFWKKLKQGSLDNGKEITQKIAVNDGKFQYFVNGEPAGDGALSLPAPKFLALRACGLQTVAFTRLRASDDETGATLLEESFDNAANPALNPDTLSLFRRAFQNGSYLLEHKELNRCRTSMIPIKLPSRCDIRCYSTQLKGEATYFGLGLFRGENSFSSFELTNKGATRFANYENDAYRATAEGRAVAPDSLRRYCQYVKIRSRSFEYFVNDRLVLQGAIEDARAFKFIGFRVCGAQTLLVDSLLVTEASR